MPPVSEKQRRAMWAAKNGKSTLGIPQKVGAEYVAADASLPIAAGTVFVSPEGKVLLLKRAGVQGVDNYVGHWSLPGGKAESGETPEQAADRESAEELGNTAPVSKKKLLDRVKTPNGMVFHTFAQPVHSEFQPQLNEEHSECGWFSVGDLPKPLHPSVGRVLRENLGVDGAEDMKPEDWTELRENFAKWTREEEAEPEHADDNQPALATTVNTGIPLAAWNKKRKKKLAQDSVCPACKGAGCVKCGGSGVAPSTKAPMKPRLGGGAFDMAGFMRGLGTLASDEGFNEEDHPRAPKFGSGSGGGTSSSKYKTAGKPSWNGGKLDDPAKMETGTLESNARALKYAIKNSPFTHEQRAKREERLADVEAELKERASSAGPSKKPALKMDSLKKTGGKLGSNEGGLYEGKGGEKFYIKKPGSKAHVANERTAAALYQLAGAKTLDYRDVEGGEHVASEWKQLEKKNIRDFTPAERKEAAHDFAIHAWLSNWDAAGTGGDNQGVLEGKTTTLDVGGSLRFRAQGGPKGSAFGDKVVEWETMRNKGMSPDAAKLFAPMSESELKASVERVTAIPDAKIRAAVGDDKELADRLIARKKDLASKVGLAHDAAPKLLHPIVMRYNAGFIREPELAFDRATLIGVKRHGLAFDRATTSVRTIDADGRMHIEISNISKATVNPYLGKEIPGYKALGLEPDKIYQLLRDPAELEKAASTFNNLPLLDEHVGVNAASHRPEHVIGSTGTDAVYEHPYLKNSMVVWADRGIKAIESGKKRELSSAYRYKPVMIPGDYEGKRFDGRMTEIVGNHLATVLEGRAGSDVLVADGIIDPWMLIESAILSLELSSARLTR